MTTRVKHHKSKSGDADLLYGFHPVREVLKAGRRAVECIFLAGGRGMPRRREIADLAQRAGIPVELRTPSELTALVGHTGHQDVAARAATYPACSLETLLARKPDGTAPPPWLLLLDQVTDPQNFGAMVRTAHCAGVQGVVLPKDRSAPPSPAAVKASAGALEHMRVVYVTNLVSAMKSIKKNGYWIAGAHQAGRVNLFESDLRGALALVIGGEEKGLRPLVQQHCDFTVAIPQYGAVTSLNASAAAAVLIYETLRQRQKVRS
ncbi:MAG: 23S rRNA (guanosine(2251)-2'-O)-methyltransferase RlmB [Desulfatitalea sp.]|nr:23S rRNA (guanosine(2251)-2'-O)-methyltransferase RlmB [Desulfatitalea sp.]NNK00952.1 23S rRNA (guanosine(2251)-2'-O)-methyltransferase RlmB [Desulfatitalea sp.]